MKIKSEIVLYAPRRSGHHAIIDANCNLASRPVAFVNDQDPDTSPLSIDKRTHTRVIYKSLIHPKAQKNIFRIFQYLPFPVDLIHNYEDYSNPSHDPANNALTNSPQHIVVLRDPYNLLASRLKWHRTVHTKFENLKDSDYIHRLRSAVSLLNQLIKMSQQCGFPIFMYDDWLLNKDGPTRYAEMLGLKGRLEWPNRVAKFGPGSSFQGQTDQDAKQLDLFGRWKMYQEDPLYREVALTQEVAEIAEAFFPKSSGLEWAKRETST